MPPIGNFAPTPSAGRADKRKRAERQGIAPAPQPEYAPRGGYGNNKRAKQQAQTQPVAPRTQIPADVAAVEPSLVPALPEPMQPATSTVANTEELQFFDRVKKHLNNKAQMNEFLKICNLYSQDLLDRDSLVSRIERFIGSDHALFTWFKNFLGYTGANMVIENKPAPPIGRITLANCRAYGPSYRFLPKRERLRKCSGRDELCNSVLNDEWASHPTWASEDSGFIAHRKNIHEEGLHRIEEERHDYDHNIAIVERLIQLLEPLVQQRQMMSLEDRRAWRLPEETNGTSRSIYKRVLAKLYGREVAPQLLSDMFETPASMLPVLLDRCRKKCEEWKTSQREWEKVWHSQTQTMFWKSLDHMGINAKSVDKRQFQSKTLQNEIQARFEEQKQKRLAPYNIVSQYQDEWKFEDVDVLLDATRLLLLYSRLHLATDFPKLTTFIQEWVPLFFGLDNEKFQMGVRDALETPTTPEEGDEDVLMSEDSVPTRGNRRTKNAGLLRDVLEGRRGRNKGDDSALSGSRASTPDVASVDEEMTDAPDENPIEDIKPKTWIHQIVDTKARDIKANEPFRRSVYNMYANGQIFCFFRMFQILYERLQRIKNNENEVHETVRRAKNAKTAQHLALIDKQPSDYFTNTGSDANYYRQILTMLEDLLQNNDSMSMSHIEDTLRRYYLHSGWQLYHFERMLSALGRFATGIFSSDGKDKNWEIMSLFMKDRRKDMTTHQDELTYRKAVEKYVREGDIYRVSFVSQVALLCFCVCFVFVLRLLRVPFYLRRLL